MSYTLEQKKEIVLNFKKDFKDQIFVCGRSLFSLEKTIETLAKHYKVSSEVICDIECALRSIDTNTILINFKKQDLIGSQAFNLLQTNNLI